MLLVTLVTTTVVCLFSGFGGALVFLKKKYEKKHINIALNAAAGIMLGATVFSLLCPSFQMLHDIPEDRYQNSLLFISAIIFGAALLWVLNVVIPHEHGDLADKKGKIKTRSVLLFISAIALHKLPEGLAMGIAMGAGDIVNPKSFIIGIATQNIPEGLTISLAMVGIGYSRLRGLIIAIIVGFIQPLGSMMGYLILNIGENVLPFGMAMAGSTMLFVIINEILPETYGGENNRKSSIALFLGFVFMSYLTMVLD